MRSSRFALALLAVALAAPVQAAVIGLAGFSASAPRIEFTGLSIAATANPIAIGNVTFDSASASLHVADLDSVFAETPLASRGPGLQDLISDGPTNLDLRFATPVNRAGLWLNGGNQATSWTLLAFDAGGGLVGAHLVDFEIADGFPDPSAFAGVSFPTPFSRLSVVETGDNGQYTSVDDVYYESDALRAIALGDFSGEETVVDFTGLGIPSTTNSFMIGGVTFDSGPDPMTVTDLGLVFGETPQASGGPGLEDVVAGAPSSFEMRFATPANRIGFWLNGGNTATRWTVTAFDAADDPIGARSFAFELADGFPDPSVFAGIESDVAIARISIDEDADNGQYTLVDDVRYEVVPEPSASAGGLAVAIASWAIARRRRGP